MKSRTIKTVGAMVLVVLALGSLKFFQIQAAMAQYANYQPPPEAVTTVVAAEESWPATLRSIGTVNAVRGVTVSADLPGIVERIAFESGAEVGEGALLVQLDASQERAQLAAAESALKLAKLRLERFTGLREKKVAAQAELDQAQAEAEQAEARVGEIRAVIERKTIRARPSRAGSASARSTSASTCRRATRSCRSRRSTRSTSTSTCPSRRWPRWRSAARYGSRRRACPARSRAR